MSTSSSKRSAIVPIVLFAVAKIAFHALTNGAYGFHRDELQTLDDARHLDWGFVAYPPLTPFIGRTALSLFGTSLVGFRLFAAVAHAMAIVVAALLARRLGGGRGAQWATAVAVALSPISLATSAMFQYVAFDFLWWVVLAWLVAEASATGDPRWWVPIGAVIGLGVMTKYTIAFLIAGIVVAVIVTPLRAHLRSRWLWVGVGVSLAIAAPNILWQIRHDWITLDFLEHIHARDVRIGRTEGFWVEQLFVAASPVTIPLWAAGLAVLFFSPRFRSFRAVGVMAIVPVILFAAVRGRGYYTAPVYPSLIAAGAAAFGLWWAGWSRAARTAAVAVAVVLAMAGAAGSLLVLPIAPVGSPVWNAALRVNGDFAEQLGWEELTAEVARIWRSLPEEERARTGIFANNYGEAGAINLYGPAHGLPRAMSGVNSFWYRGWDEPEPATLIVLGDEREDLEQVCSEVTLAGRAHNRWNVANEETRDHPEIFLCRGLKVKLSRVWPEVRAFG